MHLTKKQEKWKRDFIKFCRQVLVRWRWKPRRAKLDAISMWDSEVVDMHDNNWDDIDEVMNDFTPSEYAKDEVFSRWGE